MLKSLSTFTKENLITKFTHPKDAPEGHKWQTRGGDPVRILCDDAGGNYPIVALVGLEQDLCTFTKEGLQVFGVGSSYDIIDVPTPERWVNVYEDCEGYAEGGITYESFREAKIAVEDEEAGGYWKGCMRVK